MVRLLVLWIIVLGLFILPGCNSKEIESQWADSTVVLDGRTDDWEGFSFEYYNEDKVALGVRNDNDNIYILFASRDLQTQRMLMFGGVTIWFDNQAKKKQDFGLRYAGGVDIDEFFDEQEGFADRMTSQQKEMIRKHQLEMKGKIEVLGGESPILIPANGEQGPEAAAGYRRGSYYLELKMPIQQAENIPYAIEAVFGEKISVGVELAGLNPEDRQSMKGTMGGMRGGGGGRKGGGMGGGGRGGRGGGGMPGMQRPEKLEIWLKVTLAEN